MRSSSARTPRHLCRRLVFPRNSLLLSGPSHAAPHRLGFLPSSDERQSASSLVLLALLRDLFPRAVPGSQATFHKRFPEFENNYSVAAGAFEPQTISALRSLQEVQERLLACLKMAFNNSGGLRPRDVPKSLRVAILLVRSPGTPHCSQTLRLSCIPPLDG